ncbi:hypothetical protein AMATHDRAFT_54925 [Amanita thiersii Skay4041]|uniref:DNA polymerase n=1 Tax=Amanita thiersii Skay4041 TaxID=703135 RepID=A0A2A9NZ54_9AGAR|nr:hypothetical protein AMATHDRAFT_54925 [Amanita thiersii Skay4041]
MSDRSNHEKKLKLERLAEYRRVRAGGGRALKEESAQIYDEVSEEQYKTIVRGRLQQDDFIVDDGVDGYMDNGMDDWMSGDKDQMDSEVESEPKRKATKGASKGKTKTKPVHPPEITSISAYRPKVSAEAEAEFMSNLLGTIDSLPTTVTSVTKSRKRKPSPVNDPPSSRSSPGLPDYKSYRSGSSYEDRSSDIEEGLLQSSDDYLFNPKKKVKINNAAITPETERLANLDFQSGSEDFETAFDDSFNDIDIDSFMDVDEDLNLPEVKLEPMESKIPKNNLFNGASNTAHLNNLGGSTPAWLSVYDSLSTTSPDTLGPLASSGTISSVKDTSILEPDGSLRFFWLDYLEQDGKVYFTGKLRDKLSGLWLSCCVTVEGLQRNLFVLPRQKRVEQDEDGDLIDTDVVPSLQDVYNDFDMIRKQMDIKSWKARWVKRKYAFGEKSVPRGESQWMKVVYGFNEPQLPPNACSPTIAQIFGTNTSAFELLVVKRKIMGPCWLQITKPKVDNRGVSWCKVEAVVSDPKDINPFPETNPSAPKDLPTLTVASLSIRTIVNHKENQREVVCVTSRIWQNMAIDDPTPPENLACIVQTLVRPLVQFPANFVASTQVNSKGSILPVKDEQILLNNLLASLFKADPDVIVGHEFLSVSLDVLLHRMRDLKADHWSRLGRFRRSRWPSIGRQGTNMKFLAGRLICDLGSDGAKSMIPSTTWSLTEMCKTHLKIERQDIDPDDTVTYFGSDSSDPKHLLTFVRHCELDAHLQMAIGSKVQILPLTRQLTNLAGNAWNKTLNGGRAERNEYILLHEFHRLKYICPDKTWGKKAAAAAKAEIQDDDAEGAKPSKGKRDKYKGGLVFEPKRGLHDKFILVMDFNSLYPSIIQEYNIDFTTVEAIIGEEEGEEKIPEPPDSHVPQGVLPRLIATLVSRRRQVKSLMKDKSLSHAKRLQYDIKQQALKLTANSMYGCLGFEFSRFYARPLAALTTYKGREILTHTRELAESLELDVVYGDTDSVFVNSGVAELSEALRISAEFKKAVNDRYKLLEIDLDGVFQRLLLLQKKKYAAVKVEDGTRTSVEVKGLDMKRREYCALSKNVSQYVLERILSGDLTETAIENIHEYLTSVGENVRNGKVRLEDFIIFKRLGKNPDDYPDGKSLPHVQVALRMKAKGGTAKTGDVIPYIFCIAEGEEPAKTAQAERAKHPDEVRRSTLKVDYEHYLSQQVLPPIERLCEPIEGTDRSRLAECLGLDPLRYRTSTSGNHNDLVFTTFDSQISDVERFRDVVPFLIRCRGCHGELSFTPIHDSSTIVTSQGAACPSCHKQISTGSLLIQLQVQIRACIAKYYEGWTICDDPTCGNRTRMMSVYGRRCLQPDCKGSVAFEYTDLQLYNQLRYFAHLFDGDKAKTSAKGSSSKNVVEALVDQNQKNLLQPLGECVRQYLDQNGRCWVDLSNLFSFMKL